MKYVVIGGVAGGPSFATRLRRIDEDAEIIILQRGAHISYASCALPYYISDMITEREPLIERTPEILKQKNNIDVRVKTEVTNIDPDNKFLSVTDLATNESYTESYDLLIIATGASPTIPDDIEGVAAAENLFTLRNVNNADAIKDYLSSHNPQSVGIIGAGSIGIELAESFRTRGLAVTIIEKTEHAAYPYDDEITEIVQKTLADNQVNLLLKHTVKAIRDQGNTVVLEDDEELHFDMLILAVGVSPNSQIAIDAGIATTSDGHIQVNDRLETNLDDIYAIGDVIETKSLINGLPIPSLLSSAANRQGHLLADRFGGADLTYPGFIGAGVAKFFNLTASFTGFTENMLKDLGITNYKTVFITPFNHAYFYPEASRVNFKLIFEVPSGKILGAQAIGEEGVDKRISQISVALYAKLSVYDLPALEIPYSPPYSSTRDVINIAGYVAINQLNDKTKFVTPEEISEEALNSATFLDIKEIGKPAYGSVEPTINIPLSELRDRASELPSDKPVYITARKGLGPYNASRILNGLKFEVFIIKE